MLSSALLISCRTPYSCESSMYFVALIHSDSVNEPEDLAVVHT